MKTNLLLICSLSLILALSPLCYGQAIFRAQNVTASGGGGSTPFITGVTASVTDNSFTGCLGFEFTVGASNITVTDLGRWVISGNSQSHTLILQNQAGTQLATVAVNTSGAPTGQFLYGSITPVVLTAGAVYDITSSEVSGMDLFYTTPISVSTTGAAGTLSMAYNSGVCPNPVNLTNPGEVFVPVNFKYHL